MSQKLKVRFAPSPTGYLHVGGARTALYNYLLAKKEGGTFILRVEDTDLERSTEESVKAVIDGLHWLGLTWDEGLSPDNFENMGDHGPYRQSQRADLYKKYADQLIEEGQAYYCFLTDEEIDAQREEAKKENRPPHVQSPYRDWTREQAEEKMKGSQESPVVRFKVPTESKNYTLNDLVRGEVTFPSDMIGDFVMIRSNGMPVYNFCCTVDDALMEVTHVLRGEDHLSNTLRQLMIYEALDFKKPKFGHLSMILGADKQKLSKRHGATSVSQYEEMGYLPEALNNFLALMGWSSPEGKEVLSREEMIEQFSTDRFNPAPAVFDEQKLKWMNATHLRALPYEELWARVKPFLDKENFILPESSDWIEQSLELMKTSMETLVDAVELYRPLSKTQLVLDEKAKDVLTWETTKSVIEKWMSLVEKQGNQISTETFIEMQNQVKTECEVKGKNLFMPIRVAVIGKAQGAELKQLVPLIDKATLMDRARFVLSEMSE